MRQLNRWQNALLVAGGAMMVVGAVLFVLGVHRPGAWVFLAGAAAFGAMQLQQEYLGRNFVIARLRRIMLMADVCFLLAGLLMVENAYNFLLPLFVGHIENGINAYIIYIAGKWVVVLLIGALLEVYTTFRMSSELQKEAK